MEMTGESMRMVSAVPECGEDGFPTGRIDMFVGEGTIGRIRCKG
jgi:hypothetical protein